VWDDPGGGDATIQIFQPNRTFIISAPAETHEKVADLLTQLRRLQDLQVTIEVKFITVEEGFAERFGVDFDVRFDNNNDNFIRDQYAGITGPQNVAAGAVTLDPSIVANNGLPTPAGPGVLGGGNHFRGVTFGRQVDGSRTTDFGIPVSQSAFSATGIPAISGFSFPALGTGVAGGTNFGIAFLNDIDVYLLLEAAQFDARANIMQAPKVTAFNGQPASVIVARQVPFVVGAVPVLANGAVAFDPIIQSFLDGTTLQVIPVVSADRRYVRVTIIPIISSIESDNPRTIQVGGAAGGGGIGGGNAGQATATIQLPIQNITTVQTTVSVPDGGTVLMGGLKFHGERRIEAGTPVMSKLPYLNRLFKSTGVNRYTRSLMLMVTPRIIIQAEEEENLGIPAEYIGSR
jgi:general secretion pathway protein D